MARRREIDSKLMKILTIISSNIESLRKARGWTQAECAERCEGDLRWYQRLESGKHVLSLETVVRLALLFRVDVDELFKP
jgi:transcriptional regulator with XRE-family HTH domain